MAKIGLVFLDATAAADDRRGANPALCLLVIDESQRVALNMKIVGDTGRKQAFRLHEDGIFGEKIETFEKAMQGRRRFPRTTGTEQQDAASLRADTRAVQGNQAKAARREREDGELDELVAQVIWTAQHVFGCDDQAASSFGREQHVVASVHDAAEHARARLRAHRRRLACVRWRRSPQQAQRDMKGRDIIRKTMRRQVVVSRSHQIQQRFTVALEMKIPAQQLSMQRVKTARPLAKRVRTPIVDTGAEIRVIVVDQKGFSRLMAGHGAPGIAVAAA
ncbi:hypothetical protein [Rhodanobacter sp. L36]|uniref:hypothetical protein n=1 Tax=Rhodanobacter sp. L36 TaxID=1747221 RepID=UPI00131AA895|nr:hypothetical protein [Rhodanobacter sp. L36]